MQSVVNYNNIVDRWYCRIKKWWTYYYVQKKNLILTMKIDSHSLNLQKKNSNSCFKNDFEICLFKAIITYTNIFDIKNVSKILRTCSSHLIVWNIFCCHHDFDKLTEWLFLFNFHFFSIREFIGMNWESFSDKLKYYFFYIILIFSLSRVD